MEKERLLGLGSNDLKEKIWVESKKIGKVGFPAMLGRVTQFGMYVVTQAFIGNIGENQLAGYALIQIISLRFFSGILLGMSSATETLCGQAFGAKKQHMMGIYLQRSWIINFVTVTIILPVFLSSPKIFQLLGQETQVVEFARELSLWFIPVLYFLCFSFATQQFLQAQMKNMVVGWLSAVSFAVHVLLSWIFVSKLDWGIAGAMSSMIISDWMILIGMFVYIFGGWCSDTWKGFSLASFSDLLPTLKLSISSGIMICLEQWYTAILVIWAGYMKNATTQVSALSICINITSWEYMLCFAFLVASSVRVSNELGRGDAKATIFSVKVTVIMSMCIGVFFFILSLTLVKQMARIFTNAENVVEAVSNLSTLLAFTVLLNSFQTFLSGVAVGSGRQSTVAYINITSYYIIGVPLGIVLGYVAKLQIEGIWIGMTIGVVIQVIILGYITSITDWNEQVKRASERLAQFSNQYIDESLEQETMNG